MYRSSCFIGRFIIGYYYFTGMNFIIFYDVFAVTIGDMLLSFLNDDIGRLWYFFSSNCLPDNFYIKCWVFLSYICIFVFKIFAVWGRLLSITVPMICWFWYISCLFIIDFDDCWRLKFVPVWDINLKVLFDSLNSTFDPYLDKALDVGLFPANLSAEGTLLRPAIGVLNF